MITGLALFTPATYTWVGDRLRGKALNTEGVYKLSRHPMYLGFIIWSYGLLYLASTAEPGRGWAEEWAGRLC
jgi:protein-S-isoprenylcysteine O-methyltransferase Ste14